ncbi:MAG: hypothetical protein M1833_006503 [Piccolia ochrophora]|nr:MAG: hypothetical protein M1833_006503 [Piccolia ochrophora]
MWGKIWTLLLCLHCCWGQDPPRPYPLPDAYLQTTSILNHSQYIQTFDEPQWYLDNIPFVDFPDQFIQDVYYYRSTVIKRHLKYNHEGHGWSFTEFIQPVAWASKFQTIPDSAAHHIVEARWLRNPRYTKDLISLYTRGGAETLEGVTYTHYVHRAILEHAQATGDLAFLTSQLLGMIKSFHLWNVTVNNVTGLYHRTPLLDAMEFSLPGFLTGGLEEGPVGEWNSFDNNYTRSWEGPETYRVSHNAYMVAGAQAISTVAQLAGDDGLAQQWSDVTSDLYGKMQQALWEPEIDFWIDVVEGSNLRAIGRQLIGFFPFRFDIGTEDMYIRGLEASLTEEGFLAPYGPTTLEQRNPYYSSFKNGTSCCEAFSTYTLTNYKDGIPSTLESHYPTIDRWSADTSNYSEHYLHSTYIDNIFTNLIGILPTTDDRLELRPLIPDNWTYFAVENLPYHGSLFSILWDQAGNQYSDFAHQPGLSIYSNGSLLYNQPNLSPVNVTLFNGTEAAATLAARGRYENILANPNAPWGFPNVSADYAYTTDGGYTAYPSWKMNDGLLWYDTVPDNFWTNNQSAGAPYNVINVTLPRPREFNSVSLAIYDDSARGGVVKCPAGIKISARDGKTLAERNPWTTCVPNSLNTVLLDEPSDNPLNETTPGTGANVELDFIQILLSNQVRYSVGVSEIQIWVPAQSGPRYEAEDGLQGIFVGGFDGTQSGLNATIEDGGVTLGENGWIELADVQPSDGTAGNKTLTVISRGTGTVNVQMNFLSNITLELEGETSTPVDVEFLEGNNVVTIFQISGNPFVDAIEVA